MPHHLITLRRSRLRDALNLDTGTGLTWLKRLFFHLIVSEELAAIPARVPVEPGPIIAGTLIPLLIPPPAPLGHPLRQHVHHLTVFGLIVEEVLGNAYEHHLALLGDLHGLHKRLDPAGLHGEIPNGSNADDDDHGQETGKAKPQRRMPLRRPITALDLPVDVVDALDFGR